MVLPEEIYYTPKATVGYFYEWIDSHLITVTESTDTGVLEGNSMPIGCIENIRVVERARKPIKMPKITMKFGNRHPVKIIEQIIKVGERHE